MHKIPNAAMALALLLQVGAAIAADKAADGALLAQVACSDIPTYEQYLDDAEKTYVLEIDQAKREHASTRPLEEFRTTLLGKAEYEARRSAPHDCFKITYLSDDLKVVGYLFRPRDSGGKRLPVVIFNRAGERALGAIKPAMLVTRFYPFLKQGFVVLAPQYRGNDGGEGKDEFGGADVHDVLNLVPLARSLPYADPTNIFMAGHSRGGMMTYAALRDGADVNAAAVTGAPSDFAGLGTGRPLMVENVFKQLIPDYEKNASAAAQHRSALHWAEKISVPLLILHGTADWRVAPSDALRMALRLSELRKPYELVMYGNDLHSLAFHHEDRDARIVAWFRRHMK